MILAIDQLIAALQEAVASPVDGTVLADLAKRWLQGEGDRYFLRGDVRALLRQVSASEAGEVDPAILSQWILASQELRRRLHPERNPYVDPSTARLRAIALGVYTNENVPSLTLFASMLDRLCDLLHQWLGRRLAVTTYTLTMPSDRWGHIRLPEWPVLGVESIAIQGHSATGIPLLLTPIHAYWQGTREIETGFRNHMFEVTYTAGLDPVPESIVDCLIDLLLHVVRQDSTLTSFDMTWFNVPFREIESVNLPGGLSKTFSIPEVATSGTLTPPTYLDQLLYPLISYRKGMLVC